MHEVVCQENNKIEISLYGDIKETEFREVAHELESMCAQHPKVDVLLDAGGLKSIDVKQAIAEYDFFTNYKDKLNRVGLITDSKWKNSLVDLFAQFSDVNVKTFTNEQTEDARKWVFPSPLP